MLEPSLFNTLTPREYSNVYSHACLDKLKNFVKASNFDLMTL